MINNVYQLAGVLESPIISEKSTNAAEKNKQFVFKVLKSASKNK
jgi:Ribosomal protein L23.